MARIRIVRRPDGEAPEDVRDAWIGLILETLHDEPFEDPSARGSVTHRVTPMTGVLVLSRVAIAALEAANQTEAVTWWRENTAHPCDHIELMFNVGCYEILGN